MAARSATAARRAVDGLLLLNKPAGMSSNRALQSIRWLLGAQKAGHTGSLDPLATGMLPLCFGEGTKVSAYLLNADKIYRVSARLGESRDSGDAEGRMCATAALPALDAAGWRAVLADFVGTIEQVPPMYSALKKDGRRLYELARRGEVVEREARRVTIHGISLLESAGSRLVFRVHCSKGTYVRTLVEDIAAAAGTVAYTAHLHREQVAHFRADDMLDLAAAERLAASGPEPLERALLPVDVALTGFDSVTVSGEQAGRFLNGQGIPSPSTARGLVRVYGPSARFLGIAESGAEGELLPRRVFRLAG